MANTFLLLLIGCLFGLLSPHLSGAERAIKIPKAIIGTSDNYQFFTDLLQLALSQGGEASKLQSVETKLTQARQLKLLDKKGIDVTWMITTIEREDQYLAIYEPLILGLFGYRVLLVHKNSTQLITPATTLLQLKQLVTVQGRDWPDSQILLENGFTSLPSDYENAFRLLNKQYIDYLPRGVTEVAEELSQHTELSLEAHHVLHYPNLMYFFVQRNNTKLAARIKNGLVIMKQNGMYQDLVSQYPIIQEALNIIKQRKVLNLEHRLSDTSQVVYNSLPPLHL